MEKKYPFFIRSTVSLFGIMLFIAMLFILRDIMVPLAFAFMIAILLNPLVNFLVNKKISKVVAIAISLLLAMLFVAGIMYFISSQLARFSDNWPELKKRFSEIFRNLQIWLQNNYSLTTAKQDQLIKKAGEGLQPFIGDTLMNVFGAFSVVFLLPVYTFLALFYKNLIVDFLYEVF